MELQGKKAIAHDFLSLRKDSSSPDSRPSPQGFTPKTHDFLPPLEHMKTSGGRGATGAGKATPAAIDLNIAAAPAPAAEKPGSLEHLLPGCFGQYGVGHVRGYATTVPVVVKPEWSTCAPPSPSGPEARADTEGSGGVASVACNGTGPSNSYEPAGVHWREPGVYPRGTAAFNIRGPHHQHLQQQQRWPSPSPLCAAARGGSSCPPCSSSGKQPDKTRLMDAASRSNKGFADDDDDEEEDFGKNETSSHKGLTVKVDGGNNNSNNNDQKPSTPRSKHSATEQRRRSKINDRFQILRSLIPHSDQKRDKASFLLEVIEYVHFLQEKVQKYESSYPEWSHDNVKLMPWKNSQTPGESMVDPSHMMKSGPVTSDFIFPADGTIASAPTVTLNAQNVAESENVSCGLPGKSVSMQIPMQYPPGGGSGLFQPQQRLVCDSENMVAQPQAQWLRSCTTDCSVSTDILSGQDDLVIDEGTISLSSMYSEGLLNSLTQALQSSGVDLSQASISVQINLGRQAISRPMSSTKDQDDPSSSNQVVGHSRVGSSGEESEQANKRRKSDAI